MQLFFLLKATNTLAFMEISVLQPSDIEMANTRNI